MIIVSQLIVVLLFQSDETDIENFIYHSSFNLTEDAFNIHFYMFNMFRKCREL